MVILPGAEGGDEAGRRFGPTLARLGYAAVSLPYYSPNWGKYGPPPPFPTCRAASSTSAWTSWPAFAPR